MTVAGQRPGALSRGRPASREVGCKARTVPATVDRRLCRTPLRSFRSLVPTRGGEGRASDASEPGVRKPCLHQETEATADAPGTGEWLGSKVRATIKPRFALSRDVDNLRPPAFDPVLILTRPRSCHGRIEGASFFCTGSGGAPRFVGLSMFPARGVCAARPPPFPEEDARGND